MRTPELEAKRIHYWWGSPNFDLKAELTRIADRIADENREIGRRIGLHQAATLCLEPFKEGPAMPPNTVGCLLAERIRDTIPQFPEPKKINAPFDMDQVMGLASWQASEYVHPFTCCDHVIMTVDVNGFHCPTCGRVQTWCHDFMADGCPGDPFKYCKPS